MILIFLNNKCTYNTINTAINDCRSPKRQVLAFATVLKTSSWLATVSEKQDLSRVIVLTKLSL